MSTLLPSGLLLNGCIVRVVDNGEVYSTNRALFKALDFKNKKINTGFKNGTIAIMRGHTEGWGESIYKIEDVHGNENLIAVDGLEAVYDLDIKAKFLLDYEAINNWDEDAKPE